MQCRPFSDLTLQPDCLAVDLRGVGCIGIMPAERDAACDERHQAADWDAEGCIGKRSSCSLQFALTILQYEAVRC